MKLGVVHVDMFHTIAIKKTRFASVQLRCLSVSGILWGICYCLGLKWCDDGELLRRKKRYSILFGYSRNVMIMMMMMMMTVSTTIGYNAVLHSYGRLNLKYLIFKVP
jgi:hypothetical protein